jgi:uncharacterized membrane protein
MSSRIAYTCAWVILLAVFVGSFIVLPSLPPVIATHWNAAGQVNGTMSSLVGTFIIPFVMLAVLLALTAIPYIDPLSANFGSFRAQYDIFVALFMTFLALIQATVLAWNLGIAFDIDIIILPAVGALLFYIGTILPRTKRNWSVGIRTPWTISSDIVWKKTHELGGLLFRILGIVVVLSVLTPSYALFVILVPLVIVVAGLVLYSYAMYREYAV